MKKKKIIIFEGLKGAGKTILINQFIKENDNSHAFFEEKTLKPIKHEEDIDKVKIYYNNLIKEFQECSGEQVLLDRFYFTKWRNIDYDKKLFQDIERKLMRNFDVSLVLLIISEKDVLKRLKETQKYRKSGGWKLNYDGAPIEEEARKDILIQEFFLKNQYKDTLIKNKIILDTTSVEDLIRNIKGYTDKILRELRGNNHQS